MLTTALLYEHHLNINLVHYQIQFILKYMDGERQFRALRLRIHEQDQERQQRSRQQPTTQK